MPDVVLPALNESAALPRVLSTLPHGYRAIVVDNGSSDGSGEIAAALGARVVVERQRGFGAACFAGLSAATDDVVCFMDCDGSLDPRELPRVARSVVEHTDDLVLGARQAIDARAWAMHARAANRFLAARIRRRTGLRLTDLGPMRAARREALLRLDLADRRCGWPLEMVLKASAAGWRIREVPVSYSPRVGRSKVTGTLRGTALAAYDMGRALR